MSKENMTALELKLTKVKALIKAGKELKANKDVGLPKRYQGKGLIEDFKFHEDIRKVVQSGDGLFLTGKCGTGKTRAAVGVMLDWYADTFEIVQGDEEPYIAPLKGKPVFITVPELLFEIKSSWSDNEGRRSESEADIIKRYADKPPLLVLDDLGAEKSSEWARTVLAMVIDRRYLDCKQTIITSNLGYEELLLLDDRIASRICEIGETFDLGSKDWRVELRKEKR